MCAKVKRSMSIGLNYTQSAKARIPKAISNPGCSFEANSQTVLIMNVAPLITIKSKK